MVKLIDIAKQYRKIYIATHKSPDADAISSAIALKTYFDSNEIESEIIGTVDDALKINVKRLISKYNIPLTYISEGFEIDETELLFLVDCQYGSSNSLDLHAENIAVIDHHIEQNGTQYVFKDIRSKVGACASIIYSYLAELQGAITSDLATTIYFGIYMDTNGFSGRMTNLDKDAKDSLERLISPQDFDQLRLSSLLFSDLMIFANGFLNTERYENIVFSNFEKCEDSLLGHISDLLSELDEIQIVIAYTQRDNGYKLSIRSYHNFITAEELAVMITMNIGGGGGNRTKAGGFILKDKFERHHSTISFPLYLKTGIINYIKDTKLLKTGEDNPLYVFGEQEFIQYRKKQYRLRYLQISDHFHENIVVKTLEGVAEASLDDLVIIGLKNEVWPVSKEYFAKNYNSIAPENDMGCLSDNYIDDYGISLQSENSMLKITRDSIADFPVCCPKETSTVKACKLNQTLKVRTKWGDFLGKVGDYLIYQDINDYYICDEEIFLLTYGKVQ